MTTSCPLCNKAARSIGWANYGRYSATSCTSCGDVAVTEAASDRMRGLPEEFKARWQSLIAAAAEDQILLVRTEPVGSGGGLVEEYLQRSAFKVGAPMPEVL